MALVRLVGRVGLAALVSLVATFGVLAAAPSRASSPTDGITILAWLAGCWEQRTGARITQEHWMAPAGGMMLGLNRTVVRDTTRAWEYLAIEERDSRLVYTAKPSGQAETSFTSALVSDTLVRFENPAHDFPQRIMYRRIGRDSLLARVEGPRGGEMQGIDFPMRRVACP